MCLDVTERDRAGQVSAWKLHTSQTGVVAIFALSDALMSVNMCVHWSHTGQANVRPAGKLTAASSQIL